MAISFCTHIRTARPDTAPISPTPSTIPAPAHSTWAIFHVDKVKAQTLKMVGERGLRTPVPQSGEMYVALKSPGAPTKFISEERCGASSVRPSNMLRPHLYMRI